MRTLIVEDEAIVARQLEQTLTEIGHEVVGTAMRTGEAVRLLDQHGPEIALIDIVLKSTRDEVDLAHIIRDQYGVPFIYTTAHSDDETVRRARETHPSAYLVKPFDKEDVYAAMEIAASNHAFGQAGRPPGTEAATGARRQEAARATGDAQTGGLSPGVLRRVIEHIDKHYNETLRLETLAEVAGMSQSHFARQFKQSVGTSPYQHVIRRRVEEGARLPRSTEWPVSQVSLEVGYESQGRFTQQFKKRIGATPGAYRKAKR